MKILRLSTLISVHFFTAFFKQSVINSYPTVIDRSMDPIQNFPPHVILAPRRAAHYNKKSDTFQMLNCHSDFFRLAKTLLRLYLKLALISNNFRSYSDCCDFLSFFEFKRFSDSKTLLRLHLKIPFSTSDFFQIAKTLLRLHLKVTQDHAEF